MATRIEATKRKVFGHQQPESHPLKTENIKELTKIVDRGEGPKSQSQREQRKGEDQGTARDSYDPSPQLSNIPDDRVHVFPRNIGDWQTEEGMHVS